MFDPFCDWLDVTYSPDDHPTDELALFLQSVGMYLISESTENLGKATWGNPDYGTLVVHSTGRFVRVSASGGSLAYLRTGRVFDQYLAVLSSCAYRVTRLDAACDYPVNAAPLVEKLIVANRRSIRLTRKNVQTSWSLAACEDGQISGTFYAGNKRSGGITARVYDKQKEQFDTRGLLTGPWIRYEVTVRRGMFCTLKDAHSPAPLFWHVASPSLLASPPDVSIWVPSDPDDTGWLVEMPSIVPYQVLKRRVESSPDLGALIRLADECGPHGRQQLVREFEKRLKASVGDSGTAATKPAHRVGVGVAVS